MTDHVAECLKALKELERQVKHKRNLLMSTESDRKEAVLWLRETESEIKMLIMETTKEGLTQEDQVLLVEIDALLSNKNYEWAWGFLNGIKQNIEKRGFATDKDYRKISNIQKTQPANQLNNHGKKRG